MPSILIPSIPPLLVTAALIFVCGLPRALALPRIDNVLTRSHNTLSCAFELAGYTFDLCPLADLVVDLDLHAASNPDPQSQADNFRTPGRRLRLALPFGRRGATPGAFDQSSSSVSSRRKSIDNQCLKKDWICVSGIQTPENVDEGLTSTFLSWEAVAGPGLHAIQLSASDYLHDKTHEDGKTWDESHTLSLSFIPKMYGQLGPKVHFFCDAGSTISTSRIEVDRDSKSGTYTFGWHTPHACPAVTGTKGEIDEFRIGTNADLEVFAEEDETPGEEDEDPGEEDEDSGEEDEIPGEEDGDPGEEDEDSGEEDEIPGEEDGTSGEENNGGDFLKPNRPSRGLSRPWIATLIFALGTIAISVCIVVSSPRIRRFVLGKLSAFASALSPTASRALDSLGPLKRAFAWLTPTSLSMIGVTSFRQGDSQLVRWAEEDMALEEDFMVNGSGAYQLDGEDWNGANLDEYIPLTISPKWGRRVRSYGTTPLSETFSRAQR